MHPSLFWPYSPWCCFSLVRLGSVFWFTELLKDPAAAFESVFKQVPWEGQRGSWPFIAEFFWQRAVFPSLEVLPACLSDFAQWWTASAVIIQGTEKISSPSVRKDWECDKSLAYSACLPGYPMPFPPFLMVFCAWEGTGALQLRMSNQHCSASSCAVFLAGRQIKSFDSFRGFGGKIHEKG